jgi:hypothetical protein
VPRPLTLEERAAAIALLGTLTDYARNMSARLADAREAVSDEGFEQDVDALAALAVRVRRRHL